MVQHLQNQLQQAMEHLLHARSKADISFWGKQVDDLKAESEELVLILKVWKILLKSHPEIDLTSPDFTASSLVLANKFSALLQINILRKLMSLELCRLAVTK